MSTRAYKNVKNTRTASKIPTPQTEPIAGKAMVQNNAGGYVFQISDFSKLDRFLILGTEGNTYYVSEHKMTEYNANSIISLIKSEGKTVVHRIVEISTSGRAPKNEPALFALALCMSHGNAETKNAAYDAIPKVARIGTHILHLAEYVNGMRGWGRGVRRGFSNWYNQKQPKDLAMQLVKYANRDGWTHKDILRLAHVKPASPSHDYLFNKTVDKTRLVDADANVIAFIDAVDRLKTTTNAADAIKIISEFKLPREVVPTELLNDATVWEALLPNLGMEALVRNLATLTRLGIISTFSQTTKDIVSRLTDEEVVRKSRIHPIKAISALLTYKSGRGFRGSNTWSPVVSISDALEEMFYMSFKNVNPSGKRMVLALDVSGSMSSGFVGGIEFLSPRIASAVMAMVTARTEKVHEMIAFSQGHGYNTSRNYSNHDVVRMPISPTEKLDRVVEDSNSLAMQMTGTDCSLPMLWALENKIQADAFVVYTDSETWAGRMHPIQALNKYRNETGINAKLIVVGMTATEFSIADPSDKGSLDVVGFDTATPELISGFVRGDF